MAKHTISNSIWRKVFQLFILFGAAALLYVLILASHRLKVSLLQTKRLPHVVSQTSEPIIGSNISSKDPINRALNSSENVGDLFQNAVPIAHSSEWTDTILMPYGENYSPISDSDTLMSVSMDGYEHFHLQKRDLHGNLTKSVDITKLFKSKNRQISRISISPDRKFIAYEVFDSDKMDESELTLNLTAVNGSMNHSWQIYAERLGSFWLTSNFIWSRDSKSLICLRGTLKEKVFIDIYPVTGSTRKSIRRPELFCTFCNTKSPWLMAISPKGRIIATDNSSHRHRPGDFDKSMSLNYPAIKFYDFGIRKGDRGIHYFDVNVPSRAEEGWVSISPDANHILFEVDNYNPCDTTSAAEKPTIQKLLISKLDGCDIREIGRYKVPLSFSDTTAPPRIIDPKWSPDGMHVEFLLKDTVYSILVNLQNE